MIAGRKLPIEAHSGTRTGDGHIEHAGDLLCVKGGADVANVHEDGVIRGALALIDGACSFIADVEKAVPEIVEISPVLAGRVVLEHIVEVRSVQTHRKRELTAVVRVCRETSKADIDVNERTKFTEDEIEVVVVLGL